MKHNLAPDCSCQGCVPHRDSYRRGASPLRSDAISDYDQGFNDGMHSEHERLTRAPDRDAHRLEYVLRKIIDRTYYSSSINPPEEVIEAIRKLAEDGLA